MFRVVTILTLITATFVFSGCPKKKAKPADKPVAAKKEEPKKAEPKKAEPAKVEPKKAEPAAAAALPENVKGVAECEAYFKAYNCYIGKLPAASQEASKKGMAAMTAAWAKIPKTMMAKTCKAAVDALKKGADSNAAMKKYWDGCLPK